MKPADFSRALAEQGVLVTEGSLDGQAMLYLEVYREGSLLRIPIVDNEVAIPFSVRRAMWRALGLDEDFMPVTIQDVIAPE